MSFEFCIFIRICVTVVQQALFHFNGSHHLHNTEISICPIIVSFAAQVFPQSSANKSRDFYCRWSCRVKHITQRSYEWLAFFQPAWSSDHSCLFLLGLFLAMLVNSDSWEVFEAVKCSCCSVILFWQYSKVFHLQHSVCAALQSDQSGRLHQLLADT